MMTHFPVMLKEAIESLNIKPDGIYLDCTCGRAGHSSEILKRLTSGKLICLDQDTDALEACKEKLSKISDHFVLIQENFEKLDEVLEKLGIDHLDGILADLGVSSPQLDDGSRGFSYQEDARLDMRMDQRQSFDAEALVNEYSLEELTRVFREYGEDNDAYAVAKRIVEARSKKRVTTTFELVELIKAGKSQKTLAKKGHPAKQIFQAIRIEVNHEGDALMALLEKGPKYLNSDGRLSIITFMSLDDRLVKQAFVKLTKVEGNRENIALLPKDIKEPDFYLYSKKPILPSEEELTINHRSAPAKLRVLIRK